MIINGVAIGQCRCHVCYCVITEISPITKKPYTLCDKCTKKIYNKNGHVYKREDKK